MMIVTTETVAGREIIETLGMARGNTVRAKHIGKDIMAGLRNLIGGEIKEYTEAIREARTEAIKRMTAEAEEMEADAIVGVRFSTVQIMTGAAEMMAYGTAVKFK